MTSAFKKLTLAVAAIALPTAACAHEGHHANHTDHAVDAKVLNVSVIDAQGQAIGTAALRDTSGGVLIDLDVKGLSEGEKAFHIHETGKCTPADKFASAGGHFAPAKNAHGLLVAEGPHAGDMPNLFVKQDGTVRAQVLNSAVTLGKGDATLADADGSALVIHAGPDDYKSQPAGDAGGRIACAVIFAPQP